MRNEDLELRVRTLEHMLEITMATLLSVSTEEQRHVMQKMLGELGRVEPAADPESAHHARRFIAEVADRLAAMNKAAA